MGALGAAIAGLQASQKWLDVISENISNSQVADFKQPPKLTADNMQKIQPVYLKMNRADKRRQARQNRHRGRNRR